MGLAAAAAGDVGDCHIVPPGAGEGKRRSRWWEERL